MAAPKHPPLGEASTNPTHQHPRAPERQPAEEGEIASDNDPPPHPAPPPPSNITTSSNSSTSNTQTSGADSPITHLTTPQRRHHAIPKGRHLAHTPTAPTPYNTFHEVPQGHRATGHLGSGPIGVKGVHQCVGVYVENHPGVWHCMHLDGWVMRNRGRDLEVVYADRIKIRRHVRGVFEGVMGEVTELGKRTLVVVTGEYRNKRRQTWAMVEGVLDWVMGVGVDVDDGGEEEVEGGERRNVAERVVSELTNGFVVVDPGSGSLESLVWTQAIAESVYGGGVGKGRVRPRYDVWEEAGWSVDQGQRWEVVEYDGALEMETLSPAEDEPVGGGD